MTTAQPEMKSDAKIDATPLYHAANAAKYAAKVWLPDDAKQGQVMAVAEKIYLNTASELITSGKFKLPSGKFKLPDGPRNFAEKITAERGAAPEGQAVG